MYLHEVEEQFKNGKKIRRAGWPKDHRLVRIKGSECELSDEEKEQAGINEDAKISIVDTNVYCEGKEKATVGYVFSHEDKNSQDWEVVK